MKETTMTVPYIISGGRPDADRPAALDGALGPPSEAFLAANGLRPGTRCLDVACGTGELTRRIADRAAPGEVVGVDLDVEALEVARGVSGGPRYEAVNADHLSALGLEPFDLVNARLLLEHVPNPATVVDQMVAVCRPGGVVCVEVTQASATFGYPHSPAIERFAELFELTVAHRGGNAQIGPTLPNLLEAARLVDVEVSTVQPSYRRGPLKRFIELTARQVRGSVIGSGFATPGEYDEVVDELAKFTADPRTIIGFPRVFQVSGRRPG